MIGLGRTQRIAHHRLRFTDDGIEVALSLKLSA
jgi:hypothetical protein